MTFAFDNIGNRTEQDYPYMPGTLTYEANALNQYTQAAGATLSHDADGNLTDDESHAWTWDAENRLIKQTPTDHSTNNLYWSYDYLNRRRSGVRDSHQFTKQHEVNNGFASGRSCKTPATSTT